MKKIVLILLMSLLFTAFAARVLDTASITLTAVVQGVYEIGIFDAAVDGTGITAVSMGYIDPTSTEPIETADKYLVVRTNQRAATTMTITINPLLSSTDSNDILTYNMVFDNGALIKTVSTAAGRSHTFTIPAGNGVRVYNFPFHFTVTPAQFIAAVPASYYATVKFTYTAP